MKFTTDVNLFSQKLGLIQGIAERRATMPVLSHVLVEARASKIELSTTDLETSIKTHCDAEVGKEGGIALPARKLFEIIKEFPGGEVEIEEIGNHWVELRKDYASFKIAGLPSEDFPAIPEVDTRDTFSVGSADLEDMIDKTIFAVSVDELRRNLSGIYFENAGDSKLRLVATDGHRLSLVEKVIEGGVVLDGGLVVPKKGVGEIKKILKLSEKINMGFGDNFFMAEGEDIVLFTRLIDAEFPDYKQVTPESTKIDVVVERDQFLSALKRVSILSSEKTRSVKLKLDAEGITLLSVSPEVGEARETVPLEYDGDVVELGFNSRYLIDVLEVVGSDSVKLGFIDELSPAVIKPLEGEDFVSVIMPMRV